MSRKNTPKKRKLLADPIYNSELTTIIVNHLMKKGKKALAYKIFYSAMNQIKETAQENPIKIIEEAIVNATPLVEVKARRVRGSTRQVPLTVSSERGTALAVRWLLTFSRTRSGRDMSKKLSNEFLEASKNMGNTIRKKDSVHKMAEANKAFAKHRF